MAVATQSNVSTVMAVPPLRIGRKYALPRRNNPADTRSQCAYGNPAARLDAHAAQFTKNQHVAVPSSAQLQRSVRHVATLAMEGKVG